MTYSSNYALTGLVICGRCGHEYRRVTWARNGKKKIVWRCTNRLNNGVKNCSESPTIEESVLKNAVMSAIQQIAQNDGEFVEAFRQNVIRVIGNYDKEDVDEYHDKIEEKQREMIALISENAATGEYTVEFDRRYQRIASEIKELKNRQLELRKKRKLSEKICICKNAPECILQWRFLYL